MQKKIGLIIVVLLVFSCKTSQKNSLIAINGYQYTVQKKIVAENGAVVSAHPLASKAGVKIMKMGGNAVDAAIATQLALAVVYPQAGNLGGGGFMIAKLSNARLQDGQGKEIAIDYREVAPGKANRDMYIDSTGTARTDRSQNGHLASGVPGTVAGAVALLAASRLEQ